MLSSIKSLGLSGIEGYLVLVETDISTGLPTYETVGLPDAAVRESKERVRSAIKNSGFVYPMNRITVSLAPADMRKEGSVYDLAIALCIIAASGQLKDAFPQDTAVLGELSLDGTVRGVAGVMPMLISAVHHGIKRVMIPSGNALEAAYIKDIEIISIENLKAAVDYLNGEKQIAPMPHAKWCVDETCYPFDFSDIKGQYGAKRAAEIAVAGGHNLLLVGTPGSGKTMLARSIPSILPELTFEEALEITKIHSVTGALRSNGGIVTQRPFRAPHHSASAVSLIGGGVKAMPGEISLAHFGVLFLDELPEFKRDVVESLRQPMENGYVSISRAAYKATYPSRFMLVAAMNPCPCGNLGSKNAECRCTPRQVSAYRSKVSGPMLDRIDIHCEMSEVAYEDVTSKKCGESSADIRQRVNQARRIQAERFQNDGIFFNAQMNNRQIEKYCIMDNTAKSMLKRAFSALNLSVRAYHRVLKVARTIADIEKSETMSAAHVAEAIQYRSTDMRYWSE